MLKKRRPRPQRRWSTSALSGPTDTSPLELASLRTHLDDCDKQRGVMFSALCLADAVGQFAAPRLMTALLLVLLVVGVAIWIGT